MLHPQGPIYVYIRRKISVHAAPLGAKNFQIIGVFFDTRCAEKFKFFGEIFGTRCAEKSEIFGAIFGTRCAEKFKFFGAIFGTRYAKKLEFFGEIIGTWEFFGEIFGTCCAEKLKIFGEIFGTLRREIRMLRQILGIHSAEILSFLGAFCLSSHISPCILPPKINNLQPILPIPQFSERVEIFQAIFMINSMPKYSN